MRRRQVPLFALLGLMWALAFRALGDDWIPRVFSSWALWLLTVAVAGCFALVTARPTHGWNWLWRPLLVGLGYAVSGVILLVVCWPLSEWLRVSVARLLRPPPTSRTVPVIVAHFSGVTLTDAQFNTRLLLVATVLYLIGASFCHLANRRRHSPAQVDFSCIPGYIYRQERPKGRIFYAF